MSGLSEAGQASASALPGSGAYSGLVLGSKAKGGYRATGIWVRWAVPWSMRQLGWIAKAQL